MQDKGSIPLEPAVADVALMPTFLPAPAPRLAPILITRERARIVAVAPTAVTK
jgi:hypothetical protein